MNIQEIEERKMELDKRIIYHKQKAEEFRKKSKEFTHKTTVSN